MAICTTLNLSPTTPSYILHHHSSCFSPPSISLTPTRTKTTHLSLSLTHSQNRPVFLACSTNAASTNSDIAYNLACGGGSGGSDNGRGGVGGGGGRDNNDGNDDSNKKNNKEEAFMALAEASRSLESLPKDLKAAIEDGRIPGSILLKFFELEKSGLLSWLMKFGGFKERLLADDLFLAKVFIECGVGVFTKTAAEYSQRKENFFNELEIVFADVVMAVIADFMLVYLPAPTVSLRPPIAVTAGRFAKFFYSCPDNAFQVALRGTSYSLLQRIGAIVRNGAKLFAVGTTSSLVGTVVTNAFINARKTVVGTTSSLVGTVVTNAFINARKTIDHFAAVEVKNVPVLSTSVAYGVYMAVSSNLRYQVLAGVIEQRMLEPLLHRHKSFLSAICFAVRTGNTFLGSLLWVDYARWIGILMRARQRKINYSSQTIFKVHFEGFLGCKRTVFEA